MGSAEASIVASRFCAKAPCGTEALALILINFDPPLQIDARALRDACRACCCSSVIVRSVPRHSTLLLLDAKRKKKWLGKPVFFCPEPTGPTPSPRTITHDAYALRRGGRGKTDVHAVRTSPSYEKPRRRCPRLAVKTSFRGGSRRPSARRRPSRAPPARRGSRRRRTP